MKIDYSYVGNRVYTEVAETAPDGTPVYSRFGEFLTVPQVKAALEWFRKNDRNAR